MTMKGHDIIAHRASAGGIETPTARTAERPGFSPGKVGPG
jgi:hypothetical protein